MPVHRRLQRESFLELEQGWRVGKYKDDPAMLDRLNPNIDDSLRTSVTTVGTDDSNNVSRGGYSRNSERPVNDSGILSLMVPERKRDKIKKKLRFESTRRTSEDYEREVQEILRRREMELENNNR